MFDKQGTPAGGQIAVTDRLQQPLVSRPSFPMVHGRVCRVHGLIAPGSVSQHRHKRSVAQGFVITDGLPVCGVCPNVMVLWCIQRR